MMDDVANPVIASFGGAHLSRLHEHHTPCGLRGRQRVHDRAHIGRAVGAVAAGLSRRPGAQHAVLVGPFGDAERGVGRQSIAPGGFEFLAAVKVGQLIGTLVGPRQDLRGVIGHGLPEPSASDAPRRRVPLPSRRQRVLAS